MLRVALSGTSTTETAGADPPPEENVNFTFTSGGSAISDREHFKRELAQIVARNRASKEEESAALKDKDKGKGKEIATPVPPPVIDPTRDPKLKKRLLQADPSLRQLHKDLVIGGQLTELEFWEPRHDLLQAEALVFGQQIGRSGVMVDPRPENGDNGEIRISVTPQMIRDIFEQFPIVQRAYAENVPPLAEQTFWTRYFRSRLFYRHRSSGGGRKDGGDGVKDDEIFDRYLEAEDDGLVPRVEKEGDVYRLLDLAATEEDHGETGNNKDWTMRAGSQKSSLPLMRRFNEHSERLLDSSLGKPSSRAGVIGAGDAGLRNNYDDDILLDDLESSLAPERILLDMQGQDRYFHGTAAGGSEKRQREQVGREEAEERMKRLKIEVEGWRDDGIGGFQVPDGQQEALEELMGNVKAKWDMKYGGKDDPFPAPVFQSLTSLHSTTTELLHHFWSALYPPPASAATPLDRVNKAVKMIHYLEKTEERIDAVVNEGAGMVGVNDAYALEQRVRDGLEAVLRSVTKAREVWKEREGRM